MAAPIDIPASFNRFVAIDAALDAKQGVRRPVFARRIAACVSLSAPGAPEAVAGAVCERALALRCARGVSGQLRPVFGAGLAAAGSSALDYVSARAALAPAFEFGQRASLSSAALACAAEGRTSLTDEDRAHIRSLLPLVAAPWWSKDARGNGFFATAFAMRGEPAITIEANLAAALRALEDAGAHPSMAAREARRLALSSADPVATARAWVELEKARRAGRFHRKTTARSLVGFAACGADRPADAVEALAQATNALDGLRPRAHSLIRAPLATGLASHALSSSRGLVIDAVDAALLVVDANEAAAATAAVVASSAATIG